MLLVSPERLTNPRFRDEVLPGLVERCGLLVVDEAHCISDWGHDFRPDYRRIRDLLAELPAGTPVLATTATANARVVDDVAEQLTSGRAARRSGHDRARAAGPRLAAAGRAAPCPTRRRGWRGCGAPRRPARQRHRLHAHRGRRRGHRHLPARGRARRPRLHRPHRRRRAARRRGGVAPQRGQGAGGDVGARHGLRQARPRLRRAPRCALVPGQPTTSRSDGPGARSSGPTCCSCPAPRTGRSGTGSRRRPCPPRAGDAVARPRRPRAGEKPLSTSRARDRGRHPAYPARAAAQGARRRRRGPAGGRRLDRHRAGWTYDADRYRRVAAARDAEQEAMLDYLRPGDRACRMSFLQKALDDGTAVDCGRCDVCAGAWYPTDVPERLRAVADQALHRPGVELEPRRMWPTGMSRLGVAVSGRIPPDEQARRGTGRRPSDRPRLGPGAARPCSPTAAPTSRSVTPCCAPARRCSRDGTGSSAGGIVVMASRRRPRLVTSVAQRLAELGRLPLLGAVTPAGPGPDGPPAATARIAWPACGTGSRSARELRAGRPSSTARRCCSSTTSPTRAGP